MLLQQIIHGKNDHTEFMQLQTKLLTLNSRASRLVSLLTSHNSVDSEARATFQDSLTNVEAKIDDVSKQMDEFLASKPSVTPAPSSSSALPVPAPSASASASTLSTDTSAAAGGGTSSASLDEVRKELNPTE